MDDNLNTQKNSSPRASIVIPTYNRPDDLRNCIESILKQTVRPYEIIVVDDGNLQEPPLRKECEAASIKYIYLKKNIPGLTASRNAGIKEASGDIVFFFDDDVILFPDYVKEILNIYKEDIKEKIGGVGGATDNITRLTPKDKIRKRFEFLFLVTGGREGKVLPSGFCTDFGTTANPLTEASRVDFLCGCSMSFRRKVFDEFLFDTTRYLKYGMGEDKDFTYRVSKKYHVVYTPEARLLHMESAVMSPDNFKKARMYTNFVFIFFKSHVMQSRIQWLFFYYALAGFTLSKTLVALFSPKKKNFAYLKGILAGINDIISGQGGFIR